MSYDLLFLASDAETTTTFSHADFRGLAGKHGLDEEDWRRLVDAHEPRWRVDGAEMIFPAIERYFRNGRRLGVTPAEQAAYRTGRRAGELRYLNGLFIADYLTRRGYGVEVINALSPDFSELEVELAREPRVVAISSTFIPNRRRIEEIARWIKARLPEATVVVGGPLVTYSMMIRERARELLELDVIRQIYLFTEQGPVDDAAIDAFVVDPYGVATLAELLGRVVAGREWTDLANLAYYDGAHELVFTNAAPEQPDIARDRIDWANLPERFLGPVVALRGSLGCPLRCKFCSFVVLYPEWELKSVDLLREELRAIATRPFIHAVGFVDDNLFLRRAHVDAYAAMMAEERLPFSWSSFIRADSITRDNVDLLADSGCAGVVLGIESGDRDVLKNMRKIQRPESVLRTVGLLNERGLTTNNTFLIGFPGETPESVDRTIALINAYPEGGPGRNWFNAWTHHVFPLTPADTERERFGLEGYLCDWRHATMDAGGAYREVRRLFREVTRGAYLSYRHDDLGLFDGRPADLRRALQLRHALAIMDEDATESFDGVTRAAALDGLERLVLGIQAPQSAGGA